MAKTGFLMTWLTSCTVFSNFYAYKNEISVMLIKPISCKIKCFDLPVNGLYLFKKVLSARNSLDWPQNLLRYTVSKINHLVYSNYKQFSNAIAADTMWARSCENVSYAICEQQRCRSACASTQSDQHLCCSLPR